MIFIRILAQMPNDISNEYSLFSATIYHFPQTHPKPPT